MILSGTVSVSLSALGQLKSGLEGTVAQIDGVLQERFQKIAESSQRLDIMLQRKLEQERLAFEDLVIAEEALRRAENVAAQQENGVVLQQYYTEVAQCRRIYDDAQRIRYEVERIVNEFATYADTYKRNQQELTNDYNEVVKKSSVFLIKYADYLQQSQQALGVSGEALNINSGTLNSVSTKTQVGSYCPSNQSVTEIKGWLSEINPKFNGNPYSPYSSNCGSCALAVFKRLSGDTNATAGSKTLSITQMEASTGKTQVAMTLSEMESHLISQGIGAHAVVGFDKKIGPGHWFNAFYDGQRVYAIDGQTGRVYDWPPDYGSVTHWDVSV